MEQCQLENTIYTDNEEMLEYKNDEYEIEVKRQKSISSNDIKITTTLFNTIDDEKQFIKQALLTNVYENICHSDRLIQRIHIYGKKEGLQNNNIHEFSWELGGIYLESVDADIMKQVSTILDIQKYSELSNIETLSAVLFSDDFCTLEIYKNKDVTFIKYSYGESENVQQIQLPNLNKGKISSKEINNIMIMLQTMFRNDSFIQLISNQSKVFCDGIDMKDIKKTNDFILIDLFQEQIKQANRLLPILLIDKNLSEISEILFLNKEQYFKLLLEQFYSVTDRIENIGYSGITK